MANYPIALILLLGLAACASTASVTDFAAAIRTAEVQVGPWPFGRSIAEYDRYYAPVSWEGRQAIRGEYLLRSRFGDLGVPAAPVDGVANAYITTEGNLPDVGSVSCDAITVLVDPTTGRLLPLIPSSGGLELTMSCASETQLVEPQR